MIGGGGFNEPSSTVRTSALSLKIETTKRRLRLLSVSTFRENLYQAVAIGVIAGQQAYRIDDTHTDAYGICGRPCPIFLRAR